MRAVIKASGLLTALAVYVEPPLAAAPAVTFGVSQLTGSASQTVFSGSHTLAAAWQYFAIERKNPYAHY